MIDGEKLPTKEELAKIKQELAKQIRIGQKAKRKPKVKTEKSASSK